MKFTFYESHLELKFLIVNPKIATKISLSFLIFLLSLEM